MSDNNVFDKLASDHLETNDGEVVAEQSSYNFDDVEKLTTEPKNPKDELKEAAKSQDSEKKEPEVKAEENEGIEEKVEEESRETDENKQMQEEIKKLQAKFKDEALEIPAEALIPHKVDGEEVEIPLQELLNNYSGKVAWDKRFSELDKERKAYTQEKELVERYVNEFAELARSGDKLAAMEYLAEFAGINPIDFKKQLREQVLEKYQNYSQMSEIERKALDQEEELSYHKRLVESERQRAAEQQSQQELQSQISKIQETHQLSDDELIAAYRELDESFQGDITPEVFDKYLSMRAADSQAQNYIQEIAPELLEVDGFVAEIADTMLANPDLDANDVKEIIAEIAGTKKKLKKQQKASELAEQQAPAKKPVKQEKENYLSFDDLDF